MTWLGDTQAKPDDKKKATLLTKRDGLVAKIEALKKSGPAQGGRFPHQIRHHEEDLTDLAKEVTKIDAKLGRCVDRNSGKE